jgi:hypothetical protein
MIILFSSNAGYNVNNARPTNNSNNNSNPNNNNNKNNVNIDTSSLKHE